MDYLPVETVQVNFTMQKVPEEEKIPPGNRRDRAAENDEIKFARSFLFLSFSFLFSFSFSKA